MRLPQEQSCESEQLIMQNRTREKERKRETSHIHTIWAEQGRRMYNSCSIYWESLQKA